MTHNQDIVETLHIQPLTEEEKVSRHILGRLYGPIATCKESTRNGRHYNKQLWENALADEIFQEKINNKSLFLELGHPADREETDMEKVCACIPEMPKIVDDELVAYVDILDTPNGKLLKTLCDYGFIPGISSRGSGDVLDNNEVDPETFFLETWDIVQLPAVKRARLAVCESLERENGLKKALKESLDSASEEDKKVMETTLNELGIDVEDKQEEIKEEVQEEQPEEQIEDNNTSNEEADVVDEKKDANDDGSNKVIESLKETIKEKAQLEKSIKELQEKLAVSDTKVNELNEELNRYKNATTRLSTYAKSSRDLTKKVSELESELNKKDAVIESLNNKCDVLKKKSTSLNESVSKKVEELNSQSESKDNEIKTLKEELEKKNAEYNDNTKSLNKTIKEREDKIVGLEKKINESLNVANKYKRLAQDTVNRYIESKATMLGISANEIKNKLNETYTVSDIDKVCEDLKSYKLNMSKLPFNLNDGKVRVKIKESTNDPLMNRIKPGIIGDDDVDEGLIKMAGLTD